MCSENRILIGTYTVHVFFPIFSISRLLAVLGLYLEWFVLKKKSMKFTGVLKPIRVLFFLSLYLWKKLCICFISIYYFWEWAKSEPRTSLKCIFTDSRESYTKYLSSVSKLNTSYSLLVQTLIQSLILFQNRMYSLGT